MMTSARIAILKWLYAAHFLPGRGRLVGKIISSFSQAPTTMRDGVRLEIDPTEWVQLDLLVGKEREASTLKLIRNLVTAGDEIIDVGAHIGYHSIVAALAAGSTGKVHAFDPQPYNADRVSRNALHNAINNIVVVCAAVGNLDSLVKIPLQDHKDRARLSLASRGPNDLPVSIEVPLLRLDTYISRANIGSVKLLKIDVEGFELEVLRGLGSRIGNCSNIILELLAEQDAHKEEQILNMLWSAGFEIRDVIGRSWSQGQQLLERNIWAART
jgi:FkbM family methyltransferase